MGKILKDSKVWLIFVISILLVFLWFRSGNLLGTAESALPFYNLNIYWNQSRWAWAYPALGNITGIVTAAAPTYWLLSKVQNFQVPGFLIEAVFFWLLIFVSGISIYFLTHELFPKLRSSFILLAVGFYWFNPIFLVNVWSRFLYNYMIFIAMVPLVLLVFIKGLVKKSNWFVASLSIGILSLLFSYALTSVVFNILLWFVLGYTLVFYLIFFSGFKTRLLIVFYFLLSFIFYGLVNFWWFSQLFSFVSSQNYGVVVSNYFSEVGNLSTLNILSHDLGNLTYVVRFMHKSFFETPGFLWSRFYTSSFSVFLEFVISGIVFWGIYKGRKLKSVLYLGSFFLICVFLSKGSNLPFGDLFQLIFIKIPQFQIFRNPFEKFSLLIPLSASLLFSYGAQIVYDSFLKRKAKFAIALFLLAAIFIFWGFPFWTNFVFTQREQTIDKKLKTYEVKVPDYYENVNDWFNNKGDNFRFISFPLSGEGITYTWDRPYFGVELSSSLFNVPSISFNTTIPYYQNITQELEKLFVKDGDFTRLMNVLNSEFVLLRNDVDWKFRVLRNPLKILSILEERKQDYQKVAEFGQISIWKNLAWIDNTFFAARDLIASFPSPLLSDLILINLKNSVVLYSGTGAELSKIGGSIYHPVKSFYQDYSPNENFEERQDIFPHVRFLPSSVFYRFVILKEKVDMSMTKDNTALAELILRLLGKRLNEAKIERERGGLVGEKRALELYREYINDFKSVVDLLNKSSSIVGQPAWRQADLYDIFARHQKLISDLGDTQTLNILKSDLSGMGISPFSSYIIDNSFPLDRRFTYQFEISREGEYELFLDLKNWGNFYEGGYGQPITVQVDSHLTTLKGVLSGNGLVSFGKLKFSKGIHEIGFNTPKQKNLIDVPQDFNLKVDHGVVSRSFKIKDYDPFSKYEISFEYFIKKGSGALFSFENDNNNSTSGDAIPTFSKSLVPDYYDFDYRYYSAEISAPPTSSKGKVSFSVKPWNDCINIYQKNFPEKCDSELFRKPYDKTTDVIIRNLTVKKIMNSEPVLISNIQTGQPYHLPIITYQKVNPTLYKVHVDGADGKFYLVFSTLFNAGWEAVEENGEIIPFDKHFLADAYANGWVIDKKGTYDLTVRFSGESVLQGGIKISEVSIVVGIFFVFIVFARRKNAKKTH